VKQQSSLLKVIKMNRGSALIALLMCFLALSASGIAYGDRLVPLGKVAQGWNPQEYQYGISGQIQQSEWGMTSSSHAEASAFASASVTTANVCTQPGCGNWQVGTIPSMPTMAVCLAPVQRNGIGANGIQLNYEAGLVNTLFERTFTGIFGQVADDIPTAYGDNRVVFETPIVIDSIEATARTMDDLKMRAVAATACANRQGQTFAVAIAGSGPTVIADGSQILDTQRVVIIDSQGYKYDLLFTRVGSDFWRVEVRC